VQTSKGQGHGLHPDEAATVRAFLAREFREQFLRRLSNPGTREQMLDKFNHLDLLDSRYARRVAPRDQSAAAIYQRLRVKGAPAQCHVMGPSEIDGRDMDLNDALQDIVPYSQGAMVSCIPGRLGYFQGEEPNERYILER
jgi:hypothetical protein